MIASQHVAFTTLGGKHVLDYRVDIVGVNQQEGEPDTVTGRLVDESGQSRPAIGFTVTAGEDQYRDGSIIVDVLEGLRARIEHGLPRVDLSYA